jgi:bacillithiol synthase
MESIPRALGGASLVTGWLHGSPEALRFYPGAPGDREAYREVAEARDRAFDPATRRRVAELLSGGGPSARERLSAFVEGGGFVVTTGQQPGIFGGPLYTLYKGCTAAALARRLEDLLSRPVLPVFWIASEDHDWDEARSTWVLDPENELQEVSLEARSGDTAPPLHAIPLGEEVNGVLDRLAGLLPETDFSGPWLELLRTTHHPGATLPEAFQGVLEALLGDLGVFLLQSHAPGLKAASRDLLLAELKESASSGEALRERGRELEAAGFELQVPLLEGATNLFLDGPRGRERLFGEGDGRYRLRRSGTEVTLDQVTARVREAPGVLSPNVLLRPVVEAAVLPTLAYVAGPGEAAYLPQTLPLFRRHGVAMPIPHPRAALTLLEGKVAKVLEKFSLELDDLSRPHHELAGRVARDEMPEEVRAALGRLRGEVARGTGELGKAVKQVDPTLGGPVEHLRNQTFALLDEVEKKVVQSLKREQEIALAQLRKAQLNLFPLGRPQERVLNPFQYLVRYDRDFLERTAAAGIGAVLP